MELNTCELVDEITDKIVANREQEELHARLQQLEKIVEELVVEPKTIDGTPLSKLGKGLEKRQCPSTPPFRSSMRLPNNRQPQSALDSESRL